MQYAIFLDDERLPPDRDDRIWLVARNRSQFFKAISHFGMPTHISFDHDLGEGEPTGYEIAKEWIEDMALRDMPTPGASFTYDVHSMNPVGRDRIKNWMEDTRYVWGYVDGH